MSGDTAHFTARTAYERSLDVEPGWYISCVYDGRWWIGTVIDKSEEFQDVSVKFMPPAGPAASFHWPVREDVCHVPFSHILRVIPTPTTDRKLASTG